LGYLRYGASIQNDTLQIRRVEIEANRGGGDFDGYCLEDSDIVNVPDNDEVSVVNRVALTYNREILLMQSAYLAKLKEMCNRTMRIGTVAGTVKNVEAVQKHDSLSDIQLQSIFQRLRGNNAGADDAPLDSDDDYEFGGD
jgi:hypothetical protein